MFVSFISYKVYKYNSLLIYIYHQEKFLDKGKKEKSNEKSDSELALNISQLFHPDLSVSSDPRFDVL